ncbi:MAG: 3-isopropylmalate dehydrogenase [Anaerolineales bacterium]|nr:3-isopropylmalate dehydrogenase [Anaerolineales bacterium]
MKTKIVILPGDGIGPEVTTAAQKILEVVGEKFDQEFQLEEYLVGGAAIDAVGVALPEETLAACQQADAVLLGAVGGPKWDNPLADVRPEQGLLGLRKGLGLYANLRPVQPHPALLDASPLKTEYLQDVDLLVVRELTGGIYFGQPQGRSTVDGVEQAVDTMRYTKPEIERVAALAFQLAQDRKSKVTSVDKANVLASSRLWRQVVGEVAESYQDVDLENMLVDAAAMHLLLRPSAFDVLVTTNMFGDILTDESSLLVGSMGNLPSASLGEGLNTFGNPRGMYEPIHGSAPDIAGLGIANPIGAILSTALLFRYSLGLEEAACVVENAVNAAINAGYRTVDLAAAEEKSLNTAEMLEVIIGFL